MLCSYCLGLVLQSVIRATQCCLTVPYCLLQCYSLVATVILWASKWWRWYYV